MGSGTTQGPAAMWKLPQKNTTSPTISHSSTVAQGVFLHCRFLGSKSDPLIVPPQWKEDDNPGCPTCRCSPSRRAPASPAQGGSWLVGVPPLMGVPPLTGVPPRASGCASHRWQGHTGKWPLGAARVVHRTRRRLPLTPLLWPRSLLLRRGPAVRGGRANRGEGGCE